MLERAELLLLPWTLDTPDPDAVWVRHVLDGATLATLGLVRGASLRPSWRTWFRAQRLEVLETEDAALLMTLVRSWGWSRLWSIYDAEDQHVGSLYPPALFDAEGLRRGDLHMESALRGEILGPTGQRLAEIEERNATEALRLRFAADLEPNPFLRMLLLAAALILQPAPSRVRLDF
jgi:hypothetical protein